MSKKPLKSRPARVLVRYARTSPVQTINGLVEASSPAPVGLDGLVGDGPVTRLSSRSPNAGSKRPEHPVSFWRAIGHGTHFERTQMVGQGGVSQR